MMEPRIDKRRPWWRHLDLIGPDGRTFLRRRGFDLRRGGGILLHRIDAPDPGLDLHDHPWWFVSIVLRGGYTEQWTLAGETDHGRRLMGCDGQTLLPWANGAVFPLAAAAIAAALNHARAVLVAADQPTERYEHAATAAGIRLWLTPDDDLGRGNPADRPAGWQPLYRRVEGGTDGAACAECGGNGWVVVPGHDPGCWGDCDEHGCPVPEQVQCPACVQHDVEGGSDAR